MGAKRAGFVGAKGSEAELNRVLPDWAWEVAREILPPRPVHPLGCCRRRVDDRKVLAACLLVIRRGGRFRQVEQFGLSKSTVARRYREWARAGVFAELYRRGIS